MNSETCDIRISQAAERLGVSATHIRRLERQRRIPRARRNAFGDRVYGEFDLMLLQALGIGSRRRLKQAEEVLGVAR